MSKVFRMGAGKRVYAIGDIHGFADVLRRMHEAIDADIAARPIERAKIIYLGDYINRGPDSKGVIDALIERPKIAAHIEHIFLMGNHENGLMEFIKDPEKEFDDWRPWYDVPMCQSYNIDVTRDDLSTEEAIDIANEIKEAMPQMHLNFLGNLDVKHVVDDYLFSHAGMRPNVAIEEQKFVDLIFSRSPFLNHDDYHAYYVVHGHTIADGKKADIRPNRINLDSGLYEGGPLSCAVIEGTDLHVIEVK